MTAQSLLVFVAFALSVGLCVALHPLLVKYALARPNARSSHRQPTPQGGGIAVMASFAVTVLMVVPLQDSLTLLVTAIILAVLGLIDDIAPVSVVTRLVLQFLCVSALVLMTPVHGQVIPLIPVEMERIVLILAGVWYINLVNFMDGLDWMTVVEMVPLAAAIVLLGALGMVPSHAVWIALSFLGALLGFAPFNRPVARLFLGDVGSLPIGLITGWLLLVLASQGHLTAALLLPLYYLADATVTLLRRAVHREAVWVAHRSHFYQRATDHGWRVTQIVYRVLMTNLALATLAVASVLWPAASPLLLAVGGLGVALLLLVLSRAPS